VAVRHGYQRDLVVKRPMVLAGGTVSLALFYIGDRSHMIVFLKPDESVEIVVWDYFESSGPPPRTRLLTAEIQAKLEQALPGHRVEVVDASYRTLPP